LIDKNAVRVGMSVHSADGKNLGKVVSREDNTFVIEKGFFFPKDHVATYEEVRMVQDDEIELQRTAKELDESSSVVSRTPEAPSAAAMTSDEVRIPLSEEQLDVEKTTRQAGTVRVTKEVVTEDKQVTVPVTREEVRVERIPADARTSPGQQSFEEEEIDIPVHEEEVEVRKRPVVREEVRVSKTAEREEQVASGSVRREDVKVEATGDVRRRDDRYKKE
jgi:uncharacterized protein (TIGR02271 family)